MLVHLRHERQDLFKKKEITAHNGRKYHKSFARHLKLEFQARMLLNKYNNFFLKVERNNRCRNPDKTKGLGFLWHKALNKDIAEILVAQPIYPLMVYRLLHAKAALAAST